MKEINHRIKRTDGSRRLLKRKQIHCPKCGCRIIDASRSTLTLSGAKRTKPSHEKNLIMSEWRNCGFAATTLEEAKLLSKKVTEVTHNQPEGIKGAEATVVAIFMARMTLCVKKVN